MDAEAIQAQIEAKKKREEAEKEAERLWGAPPALGLGLRIEFPGGSPARPALQPCSRSA